MKRFLPIFALSSISILLFGGIVLLFSPQPPLLQTLSFSQAVYDKQGRLLRLTLTSDEKYRLYTPLPEISPLLTKATLLQEDRYFYRHPGVNPWALLKASWNTYVIGERRFGGSTITMQVARMRYDINSKTISGKLLQIARAIQLERHYSKNEILEAYLNLAPYGDNIEGVAAASLVYFHRTVKTLSLPEALLLSVIPQNPSKRKPISIENKKAREILIREWKKTYPLNATQKAMLALPIQTFTIKNLPFSAPHFVNDVLKKAIPAQWEIKTTLDHALQKKIERIARDYVTRKKNLGIENVAVLLVDHKSMEVKAMLGSVDFMNPSIAGQVNGTTAKRSPGSVLKPFIYALAMDQGLIHPYTVLKDAPRSFGAYNPENFDQEFLGPIKAKDALVLSRNIPAVYLSEQLKTPSLYQFLKKADVSQLREESFYGLALALGGAEITMEELARLYALLANRGFLKPLRKHVSDPIEKGKRLLSPEAAFLTWDILKQHAQPVEAISNTPVAWKTGTSSGFRDAWSVGLFDKYVILVWVGNFTGVGNPTFIGKNVAAPLMFEIIHATKNNNAETTPRSESGLTKVSVCEVSGMLPTRHCLVTAETWFIPGKSPIQTDTIHREVMINRKTGLRACRFDPAHIFSVYEVWPSDILKLFQLSGVARRLPPPFSPECTHNALSVSSPPPQIRSPQSEVIYSIKPGQTTMIIPLSATIDSDVKSIHWFVDTEYMGARSADQPLLWTAKPGHFVIRAVDEMGRSDARDIEVKIAG